MPPLGFRALRRDLDWQGDLRAILDALALHVGERQRPLLQALRDANADALQAIAEDVLEQRAGSAETRGLMPLVAAALQVAWVRLAAGLPRAPAQPLAEARALCPCCGSPPVASVVHNEPNRSGVRFLHCALCATEWHLERVKCSNCETGGQLIYLGLDDEKGEPFLPVQAEACGACQLSEDRAAAAAGSRRASGRRSCQSGAGPDSRRGGRVRSQRLQPVARLRCTVVSGAPGSGRLWVVGIHDRLIAIGRAGFVFVQLVGTGHLRHIAWLVMHDRIGLGHIGACVSHARSPLTGRY